MALSTRKLEQDVHLSSIYGGIGASDFNTCNYTNSFPGSIGMADLDHVKLKYASVPNLFDNIYAGNARFYFDVDGAPAPYYTVPNGYYSVTELVAHLNAVPIQSLVFSVTADNTINIENTDGVETIDVLGTAEILARDSSALASLNEVIGVGRTTVNLPALANSDLAMKPALFGPQNVFIDCSMLAHQHSVHHESRARSYVGCIPLSDTIYGNVASVTIPESSTHEIRLKADSNPSFIRIELRDHLNQQLSLPRNMHSHIVFSVSEQTS